MRPDHSQARVLIAFVDLTVLALGIHAYRFGRGARQLGGFGK